VLPAPSLYHKTKELLDDEMMSPVSDSLGLGSISQDGHTKIFTNHPSGLEASDNLDLPENSD